MTKNSEILTSSSRKTMFGRIDLHAYRGFEAYRLDGLRRVNLLVGRNNSGKTSVLEALHLLAANGNPRLFQEFTESRAGRRNWYRGRGIPGGVPGRFIFFDIAPFFFDHRIALNAESSIETNIGSLFMEVVPLTDDELENYSDFGPENWDEDKFDILEHGLRISTDKKLKNTPSFPVSKNGLMAWHSRIWHRNTVSQKIKSNLVSSNSIHAGDMGPLWDNMVRLNREERIMRNLRVLQPDFSELHFLSGPPSETLVTLLDRKKRVPLHSFGDGTRRFLALSLLLGNSENGLLLLDEVDTGLHWTVMKDLWELVIFGAQEWNVQVFATTHSYDCIKGLAAFLESKPEFAKEVSLQKLEPKLDEAVAFDGESLPRAVVNNIELR